MRYDLYTAFAETPEGGSRVAVIPDGGRIARDAREAVATAIGEPATCFVDAVDGPVVAVHFFSAVTELPMCGHGTVGLAAWLADRGLADGAAGAETTIRLRLPAGEAHVELSQREDERPVAMLEVKPPSFRTDPVDLARLFGVLGLSTEDLEDVAPVETAVGDFIHLVVPIRGLGPMRRMSPDFPAIVALCRDHGLETIACFTTETERPDSTIHVRDFCPAVGVAESAAAGTTNAALTAYLIRNGLVRADAAGEISVAAEQGLMIGKPSAIHSRATVSDGAPTRLLVGGVALKVSDVGLPVPLPVEAEAT